MKAAGPRSQRDRRFDHVFRAHSAAIARFALRRVRSVDEAEEVVAETFATAWRRIDDMPEEPLPWLYGIARNVVLHAARTAARQAAMVERVGETVQVAASEGSRRIADALGSMGELDREVLILAAWEGLSNGETARVLGCSRAAVGVRLFRARRRLRALLDDDINSVPASHRKETTQ